MSRLFSVVFKTHPFLRRRKRKDSGISLIELLMAMVMTAIFASALSMAFSSEITTQRLEETRRAEQDHTDALENRITAIIRGAKLTPTATDTTSFFQGISDSGSDQAGSGRITLTTAAPGVPVASINSTDDFETQQTSQGPVGSITEVSLGTTPIGDAAGQSGLFERIQHPSDGDPTQGGYETLLDPDVKSIGFQFWDGLEWVTTWDTTTNTRRLPEAVQVTYTLNNDQQETQHAFVVDIPASDVTAQNPYTATATSTAATGAAAGATP